ncbi:DUF3396 domain-containing protein [Pyxidicoccus fallax]|uniref:DUF3396 domain-containing protein n=1 Tax=Pyxidicoccus fallax TaxID=394095 RepID=A0A848LT63_9BACT|nr:type VI immunity family protein [Pyxidicoccus fallax]NMO20693.1 DUF3396 domain-containing protein [Pyxidicoccus fallax]NPC82537.1 DUF3396 domain-containing protein [Pyxidicoccus fallax]
MSSSYPRIRVQAENGYTLAREALQLCFYISRPHHEIARDVLQCLELYRRAIGPQTLGRYASADGEWHDLDESGWDFIRKHLLEDGAGNTHLRDASRGKLYAFDYFGKPADAPILKHLPGAVCAATFKFPTEYLEERGPEQVRALALQLAALLPFSSGHAGLAVCGDLDLSGVMRRVLEYCLRYPGLDLQEDGYGAMHIGKRVRGPAWLTFLGQPALNELGGIAGLRSQLHSQGTTVEPLDSQRAVITLGTWPEAGDLEQGRTLPAYRELARVLEPWLYHEEKGLRGLPPDEAERWKRRFLD